MQVYFGETSFNATNVAEQKLYRDGQPRGWLLTVTLVGDFTSSDIDNVLTKDNIRNITVVTGEITREISGYTSVSSCIIRYNDDNNTAEIQLTKGI